MAKRSTATKNRAAPTRPAQSVRKIKEGMTIDGPGIKELAARKLRAIDPSAGTRMERDMSAKRLHQALSRRQEREGNSLGANTGNALT